MSDTTFVHEITATGFDVRVTLTLNAAEAAALGLVAGAAIDASVLEAGMVDKDTVINAQELLEWSTRAAVALKILEGARPDKE